MQTRLTVFLAACALALAAFSTAGPGQAAPIGLGQTAGTAINESDGLVQKAHGFHCQFRFSNRRGWHRHWRACEDWRNRHPDRRGCWQDVFGRWHCMDGRRHRHPQGCVFTPSGIYCNF